ncbi:tRNA (guanosine(37)-N1)-methyltransferase TrmD [Akkermansiaceae bacterium]|nr:tRNA (guanosine(37)-N1)-methyltransferase TrmD [Akkermansiaceae bacterium]
MRIDILTLFPEIALAPLSDSIIRRARDARLVEIHGHNLRDWSEDKHRRVDDSPCGGGPGMVLQPGPLHAAITELKKENTRVILMTPQGAPLKQARVRELSSESHLLIVCGHYEGIDHRITETLIDEEISIGDYVLTNGAIAAAVLCDAVIRLLPGALGDAESAAVESFSEPNLLEAPCYTRPVDFMGMKVPDVLLSGNHAKIEAWRNEQALRRSLENRPDLNP